jgi:F420-non-reducing hydrogenase iron-sulfur subunit
MANPKVIVFTCNWNAYNGLETAGVQHLSYSPAIMPLKVLKAFENGADGVLLLGCPPGECHFEFGNRRAEEVFAEAKNLTALLGYRAEQFQLDWLAAGDGQGFVKKVETFLAGLNGKKVRT